MFLYEKLQSYVTNIVVKALISSTNEIVHHAKRLINVIIH